MSSNVSSGYDFLLRGRPARKPQSSTPTSDFLAHSANSSSAATPNQLATLVESPPTPTSMEPTVDVHAISNSEHGRYLAGKLDFLTPPRDVEYPDYDDCTGRSRCLFVGQLRFETTAGELRYLVHQLTGVQSLKAEARGPGCFVLVVANETDEALVRALNRRLLFDHNGVWFARTADSTESLLDYVEKVLPTLKASRRRTLRLPRDSIVVEDSRTKRNSSSRTTPPQIPQQTGLSRSPYRNSLFAAAPNHQHYAPCSYGGSSYGSEPTTPFHQQSPSGFHGVSLPDYVYSESMPPPPPYTSVSAW